jgi:carbohydrate kinase (thermoresistant glucokinase family)
MQQNCFVVMGVSGCGKTTLGAQLASRLNVPFFDADDFHPPCNIDKMKRGIALDDDDRRPWLISLSRLLAEHTQSGVVLACSALKESYRDILRSGVETKLQFIFLQATRDELLTRMKNRTGHFMPPELLDSQFADLEIPLDAFSVDATEEPERIIDAVLAEFG